MGLTRAGILVAAGVAVLMPSLSARASGESLSGGQVTYAEYCSVCHGDDGSGRSRARGSMVPPPRDFTSPQAAAELSRERMLLSVTEGRPGTAMAPWKAQLSVSKIAEVVDYIRGHLMLPTVSDTSNLGRRLYAENCSVCHGDQGKGAQWTITNMNPRPRDFTAELSKRELSRERMLQSVRLGRPDTAMPAFGTQLADADIAEVVDYVRSAFMGDSQQVSSATRASDLGAMDALFPSGRMGDSQRGAALYLMNCTACHGAQGDGKGPRAYFILPKPRNFLHPASRGKFNRPALFRAISKGSRGTEMPAWQTVLSETEIEDVGEYVYRTFIRTEDLPLDLQATDGTRDEHRPR